MIAFFVACIVVIIGMTILAIWRMRYVERRTNAILEENLREFEAGLRWRMEEMRRGR